MDFPNIFKHNLIEASAGTGKTHIIENIFVEILKKTGVSIEEILVVTFTEKATGDLKKRIRENLIKAIELENDVNIKSKLTLSLNNFDQSAIYTIHGFCNKILKEYSFENKNLFKFEIKDDNDIYEKMLYKQMRENWKERYKNNLEEILQFSNFTNGKGWKNLILNIAKAYIKDSNNIIIPGVNLNFINDIEAIRTSIEKNIDQIKAFLEFKNETVFEENSVYNSLVQSISQKSLNKFKNILFSNLFKLIKCNDKNLLIKYAFDFYRNFKSVEKKNINEYFESIIIKEYKNKSNDFFTLGILIDNMFVFLKSAENKIVNQLIVQSIDTLKKDASVYKKQNGFISYDDMIISVNDALSNTTYVELLQKKFRYGIVDEFQDTDFLQWNIIKNIFPCNKSNYLFLIADPKQAIYGFRGADIFTYFSARKVMLDEYKAAVFNLDTNYRSSKKLLDSLNYFYTTSNYFGNGSFKIEYKNIKAGEKNKILDPDKFERTNLTVFNLGICNFREAKQKSASFIAREIKLILSNKIKIRYKNEERVLTEKDICILIRKSGESTLIENELNNKNIPFSFYKKAGLYQTNEAKNLYFLFNAISNPDDRQSFYKSLLTKFFNFKINDLENISIGPYSDIMKLFNKWIYLSEKRDFQKLFKSIVMDSGLIYRQINENDGERTITNFEQILQNIERTASDENLDITGIANLLKNYIKNQIDIDEGEDLHKRETEENKVQIMTIHSSKGLEFPVVFIAGGFTKKNQYNFYKFQNDDKIVYDLNKSDANKILNSQEETEEEKRLYYVAFTRAVFYLYIPYLEPSRANSPGPLSTFIKDNIKKTFIDNNYMDVSVINDDENFNKFQSCAESQYFSLNEEDNKFVLPESLLPLIDRSIQGRITTIKSFSSIKKEKAYHNIYDTKENDEITNTADKLPEEDLPGGNIIGKMFHSILENICYSKFLEFDNDTEIKKDKKTIDTINDIFQFYIKKVMFKKDKNDCAHYFDRTLEILFNTLKVPVGGDGFRICDIENNDRLNETEFYFPLPEIPTNDIKNIYFKDGFLNGFIDMIFRKNGKYYFVDWKSNKYADFSGTGFIDRVKSDYEMQYKFYTIAVLKWLKSRIKNFDYDFHFGGIYYIYLRGRNFIDWKKGLYFFREVDDPTKVYENEIINIFKNR